MNEDLLRRALEAEASTVEVRPDALPEIRRRIAARRVWRLRWGGAFLGTGAVAVATVAAVMAGMGSCGPQPIQPPVAGQTSAGSASAAPTSAAPTSAAPTSAPASGSPTAAPPGATANVPVYYVRVDRGQPRLYREWHSVSVGDASASAKARAAVAEMLAGRPYDPDYASSWPAGVGVREVRVSGGTVTVDLTRVGPDVPAGAAVQQLVWTATAADAGLDTVRLLVDGQPAASLSGDLQRAPAVDVLGLVWLIEPQHGATVGRTFEVRVAGIVFEATMHVRVRQGTAIVSDQVVMLDNGAPAQGNATVTLSLAPGVYTLEGYEVSMADSSEQHLDSHQITVR